MKAKIVLITGCSRGLGKFLAERLASNNFIVYAGIRSLKDVSFLKKEWQNSLLKRIYPIKLDIRSDRDCQQVISEIIAKEKHLDVLINNAASISVGSADSFTSGQYLDILDTNAVGAFRLIKEALPYMRRQKKGQIINISSLNGLVSLPQASLYCSSKFALEGLTLAWRYELKKWGIWLTNIEPGAIAQNEVKKESSGTTIRKRFWLVKKFLPMTDKEEIFAKIIKIINGPQPPSQVILGRDAQIVIFLHRFLPQKLWDFLLSSLWSKK